MLKSFTIEDTFNDIEDNLWKYCDDDGHIFYSNIMVSSDNNIEKTKTVFEHKTLPNGRRVMKDVEVPKTIYENLKVKHYIAFGEQCSVCLEPITTRKSAYLTDCGHCFHFKCFSAYFYNTQKKDCPICRQDVGIFMYDIKCQYLNQYNKKIRSNIIEEIDRKIDLFYPNVCDICKDISGLNTNCLRCKKCKTGEYKNCLLF